MWKRLVSDREEGWWERWWERWEKLEENGSFTRGKTGREGFALSFAIDLHRVFPEVFHKFSTKMGFWCKNAGKLREKT